MQLRYEKCMNLRVFKEPLQKINENVIYIDMKLKSIENSIKTKLDTCKAQMQNKILKLDTLSPLKTLTRGYVIAQKDQNIIKSSKNLKADDEINLKFYDGEKAAKIL